MTAILMVTLAVVGVVGGLHVRGVAADAVVPLVRQVADMADTVRILQLTTDRTDHSHDQRLSDVEREIRSWGVADRNLLERLTKAEREVERLSRIVDGPIEAKAAELNDLRGRVGQ